MLPYSAVVLALCTVIFVPLIGTLQWAGSRLGATVQLSTIAGEQQADHKVLWLGNFKDYAAYKLERIKLVRPEVLLVGSSRCGQARAQMFRPYSAYNACLTAWPLEHIADFVDRATSAHRPRVVIVALDYFLFGDWLASVWRKERTMDYRQGIDSYQRKLHDVVDFGVRTNWRWNTIKAAVTGNEYESIDHNRLIGTEAIRGQFGFRDDGSIFVAPGYRLTSAETLAKGAEYVTSSFPGAHHLSDLQFRQLARLSELARQRDFSVVAVQYPFLKSATDFLDNDETYRPYSGLWRELRSEATAQRLSELGIRFFDMSRAPFAADASNFFDPAHPSERGMLRTFLALLDHQDFQELFPKIDKKALAADLDRSAGEPFDLYH